MDKRMKRAMENAVRIGVRQVAIIGAGEGAYTESAGAHERVFSHGAGEDVHGCDLPSRAGAGAQERVSLNSAVTGIGVSPDRTRVFVLDDGAALAERAMRMLLSGAGADDEVRVPIDRDAVHPLSPLLSDARFDAAEPCFFAVCVPLCDANAFGRLLSDIGVLPVGTSIAFVAPADMAECEITAALGVRGLLLYEYDAPFCLAVKR